jgi:hypothetical protein
LTFDPATETILTVWVNYCRAFNALLQRNDVLGFIIAQRAMWAQLLSHPAGTTAASCFGEAIVAATDAIAKATDPEVTSRVGSQVAGVFSQAGVNLLLRLQPNIDTFAASEEMAKRIYKDAV